MESDDSNDEEERSSSFSLATSDVVTMPHSMLVMSCGRGIEQRIPKIGSDGTILMQNSSPSISGTGINRDSTTLSVNDGRPRLGWCT